MSRHEEICDHSADVAYPVLSLCDIADAGTALPLCTQLFDLCARGLAGTRTDLRPMAYHLPHWPLPSMGRARV